MDVPEPLADALRRGTLALTWRDALALALRGVTVDLLGVTQ